MDLRNCPRCGKLFAYDGTHKLCPVCRNDEEEDFQKVKDYLWDNPHATIEKVHEETGVERETIIKFIKDNRLIAEGIELDFLLECERCGAPISHGRYCEKCRQKLLEGFSMDYPEEQIRKKERTKDKMFVVDRIRKRHKND